ncbi:hypothetical protein D1107_05850 [Actinobacillus pleuropneumoniae]|nr:hypothetical protein D1107_05850 [Actinobacillus pleuropneumoniae]
MDGLNKQATNLRECGNLLNIQDNYPKYAVAMGEFDGNTFEGVQCLSLREFLKKFNSTIKN